MSGHVDDQIDEMGCIVELQAQTILNGILPVAAVAGGVQHSTPECSLPDMWGNRRNKAYVGGTCAKPFYDVYG